MSLNNYVPRILMHSQLQLTICFCRKTGDLFLIQTWLCMNKTKFRDCEGLGNFIMGTMTLSHLETISPWIESLEEIFKPLPSSLTSPQINMMSLRRNSPCCPPRSKTGRLENLRTTLGLLPFRNSQHFFLSCLFGPPFF